MSDKQEDTSVGPDGLIRPRWATVTPELQHYYDHEWGMPIYDERGVFERLVLECFQAGLSWRTILEKRAAFRAAFYDFDVDRVAQMTEVDVERLMQDVGIVRNRRKIEATIHNAAATIALREDGGLSSLVWSFQPPVTPMPRHASEVPTQSAVSEALAKTLKQRGFRFVGPVSMFALMEAIGLVDTHLLSSHRRGSSGLFDAQGQRKTRALT